MTNRYEHDSSGRDQIIASESTRAETLLWMIVYLGIIGFGVFIIKSILPDISKVSSVTDIAEVVVVGATGLVLIWYTVETKRLRVESQKQTELQLRPFVVVETGIFGEAAQQDINMMFPPKTVPPPPRILTPPYEYNFRIRNVGNGTAINVRVKDGPIKEKPELEFILQESFEFFPTVVPTLRPNEEKLIFHLPNKLKPNREYFVRTIKVEFKDVNMKDYVICVEIDGGELKIID